MKEKAPIIHTFREAQDINHQLTEKMQNEMPSSDIYGCLVYEVLELGSAVYKEDKDLIGQEIGDVFNYLTMIATRHGIALEECISAKINRNFYKYNPVEMANLIASGLTPQEAHEKLKNRWDKNKDKDF